MNIFIRTVDYRNGGRRNQIRRRRGRTDGVGEAHPVLGLPTNEKEKFGEDDWGRFLRHAP